MGNLAKVIPFRPSVTVVERQVADIDDGYTRIANELLEAVMAADLTARQLKVVLAVIRKTYGFGKKFDRITNTGFTPLADSTVEARARRGRKGAKAELARRAAGELPGTDLVKPLIDTGQYRRAITHVVRDKDADS